MSIFDKEDIVTEEYLLSKGFKRDERISSPYSEHFDRFVFQIFGQYNRLYANVFYQLEDIGDPHTPQYQMYVGYRCRFEAIMEIWKSKTFQNIKDQIDFEICLNEIFNIVDRAQLGIE